MLFICGIKQGLRKGQLIAMTALVTKVCSVHPMACVCAVVMTTLVKLTQIYIFIVGYATLVSQLYLTARIAKLQLRVLPLVFRFVQKQKIYK
ncbi:hypothetical protein DBZ36_06530 [Alginatibacterium sediminis]|uniref:Uncharacterized protein n=1 Tax=Alginatibacterium sediminis TaxID=2164068 RepID=A0A420EHC6_9ALTE|nr:hypothetical protein DBZ36_06530 [Alginatibacterium sediminis]